MSSTPSKIAALLPAGVYTLASLVTTIIAPSGRCSDAEKLAFILVVLVFLGLASGVITYFLHRTAKLPANADGDEVLPDMWVTAIRVVGVVLAYLALVMLTPTGDACLFPGKEVPGDKETSPLATSIPEQLSSAILTSIVPIAAFVTEHIPQLVTPESSSDSKLVQTGITLTSLANKLIPANSYATFSVYAKYIVMQKTADCDGWQRWTLLALIIVGTLASTAYSYNTYAEGKWWAAAGSFIGFPALALTTAPGISCVLQQEDSKGVIGSIVTSVFFAALLAFAYTKDLTIKRAVR